MPVLGAPLDEVLAAGEISVGEHEGEAGRAVLRPRLPAARPARTRGCRSASSSTRSTTAWRPGGRRLRAELPSLLRRHLAHRGARRGARGLRRDARACSSSGIRSGAIDGLRIDHPDGLADPEGYLDRLAEATGDAGSSSRRSSRARSSCRTSGPGRHHRLRRPAAHRRALRRPRRAEPLADLSTELLGERQDLAGTSSREAKRMGRPGHACHRGQPADATRRRALPDLEEVAAARGARGDARRHGPLPRLREARSAIADADARALGPPRRVVTERAGPRIDRVCSTASSTSSSAGRDVETTRRATSSSSGSSRRAVRSWPRRSRTRRSTATSGSSA